MHSAPSVRKDQILQTAARLFRERGYFATSVRDIAEAVGLQGGSLYAHVASKEDLLWQIVETSGERFFGAVGPVVASDRPTLQKLRDAVIAHVGIITSDLDAAACYTTEWRHLSPERINAFTRRRDEYETLFRSLVGEGIRAGFLSPLDESYATLFLLSALNYVFLWFRPEGRMSSEAVGRMMADFIFDGLRRRTP